MQDRICRFLGSGDMLAQQFFFDTGGEMFSDVREYGVLFDGGAAPTRSQIEYNT